MKHFFFLSLCFILYHLKNFYSCILIFFYNFSLQALQFTCHAHYHFSHSHYHFNVQRVGYGQAMPMPMQSKWLVCLWCISNRDPVLWFSRIWCYHLEIFCISDCLSHSFVVFAMFAAFLFMLPTELCALVNKPSGASAGASDLKY